MSSLIFQNYEKWKNVRTSLGYEIKTLLPNLNNFLNYCSDNFPENESTTREMVDSWLSQKTFKTKGTQMNAISAIRSFATFCNSIGIQSFVPDEDYTVKIEPYTPYIFDDIELQKLFESIDSLGKEKSSPKREYILPVYFRMLYCCGMRPGEPNRLKKEDVNLETGEIYIIQSKRKRDRHLIMSEELRQLCIIYDRIAGERKYFFERNCKSVTKDWIRRQFRLAWKRSGLYKDSFPRPYDLRHCFATRTMMRWIDEKRDVMELLPYLSTYMGHKKYTYTLYYVHLLPERLLKSSGIDWKSLQKVYEMETEND